MALQSTILADNFKSGDIRPILDSMYQEFPKTGLKENKIVSAGNFASYVIGYWISMFDRHNDTSYGFVDGYIAQENKNKPIYLIKTLTKPAFLKQMQTLPDIDKQLYAEFVLLDEQEINQSLFFAGLFNNYKELERKRIGQRIKDLREQAGMTQDQLGEKTGLLKFNISRIEQGKYSTGQDILSKIATALGKKLDIV